MKREQMMEAVRKQMPAKRWQHTLGVMESAVELAHRFGGDPEKADLAALLHDYCKYWPVEKQRQVIVDNRLPEELLSYEKPLWHAPVGAFVVAEEFGIDDEEVLDAIRYHTSGRVGMSQLDKIICLADYIEPNRDYPEVANLRRLAETSMEKALIAGFDSTIHYLLSKGEKVFPMTLMARNSLIDEVREREGKKR
ncbi:bis(5'-nucleosyl)-tetraphosphatase (symmetrical) YqeK [Paenibacillus aurantius]|uniref:bis(5'-nucleosyl)-tetraphosphatase (symmetrical) n=1 Tax=Paenibacillus aurantius TaxID=2918900 RepID=A0AA96LJT0_9BACL|nr:bis(5'-nucleosyl)-tetraphosphatase (symmetrical) YqeK [Paenibacillus aurantius]WNQ13411.1 bis(5'-nucleosyl)-tetraphosphatase (symmetrical) YqeK [Paenibacillus aurantius]